MTEQLAERARHWLDERGVTETPTGWTDAGTPGRTLTANEVAHARAGEALTDDALDAERQLDLAFGLLDLLDDYWVTCEIRFADRGPGGPLPADALWSGYRRRLEAERNAEAVTYSLWVDWFEDRATSATAFAEVLGHDVDRIVATGSDPLLRRAARVLACSGPVPWPAKRRAYATALGHPTLHEPLFQGLLTSYHDLYGDLEPTSALALLTRLDLPPDTPHLTELRTVLSAGHRHHSTDPHAWDLASRPR
ncbi:hypothetical protein ACIA8O_03715 [Kitasatospora sp. NPDC051853]|uniref:hypothetical protein n=1 Tax=Kitasatospora sp. NPDC051853 TaxID=3364058 RepID=UPI00379AC004